MPQTFQLIPVRYERSLRFKTLVVGIFIAFIVFIIWWWNDGNIRSIKPSEVAYFIITLTAGGFGLMIGYRRAREQLRTFTLTLSEDRIIRNMSGSIDVVILKDSIISIKEYRWGSFTIRAGTPAGFIIVPSSLENRDQFRALVSNWKPITPLLFGQQLLGVFVGVSIGILIFGPLLVTFVMPESRFTGPCAAIVIVMSIFYLWRIQRSPRVDTRAKRGAWFLLALTVGALFRLLLVLRPPE